MTDEQIEPDIRTTWGLTRGTNLAKMARFRLDAHIVGEFVEPTRDEVRAALMQILDEALGPDPDEIAGWQPLEGGEMIVGTWDGWDEVGPANRNETELEQLRRWKAEALPLLDILDQCHDAISPGFRARLGGSKAEAVLAYIKATAQLH